VLPLYKLQAVFIAEDVESIIPEAVGTDKECKNSMSGEVLVPYLVNAVQELKTENDLLKARIVKLEAK
ncbi:MAG: hypothetical protein WC838_01945, partial [Candidatus Margulisiibacteriota bacterium]